MIRDEGEIQVSQPHQSQQLVEFEEGMWLFLRRRTTFARQRGILISKEGLPGSCSWSEFKDYLAQRLEEGAKHEADA